MGKNTLLENGFLTAGDTLKECQSALHALIHLNINEICGGKTMLGNQHGLLVSGKLGNDICCLPLERCHEFCSHTVILECHSRSRKYFSGCVKGQESLRRLVRIIFGLIDSDFVMSRHSGRIKVN